MTEANGLWASFTMTCSGPRELCARSRTLTSAVCLKMWRVSKHLQWSAYEWAGGVCVSCLRALQSRLMCIESSCVMHTHTRLHTNTHIALMPSPAMRQIFSLLPTVAVAMATSSGFLELKSWIWQEVWASPGGGKNGGGDNQRGVEWSRCGWTCSLSSSSSHMFVQVHRRVLIAPKTLTPYVNICWPPGSARVKGSQTQTRLLLTLSYSSTTSTERKIKHEITFKHEISDSFSWSLFVFRCFSWE